MSYSNYSITGSNQNFSLDASIYDPILYSFLFTITLIMVLLRSAKKKQTEDQPLNDSTSYSNESMTTNFTFDQESFISNVNTVTSLLSERLFKQDKLPMRVLGSTKLTEVQEQLFILDQEIKKQLEKTVAFYMKIRQCDAIRMVNEICQCFYALINDETEIMIGLDSLSSLKDLLITAMRMIVEENFQLEIRIGLGGTNESLTLRTPSYGIGGLNLLERLIKLRETIPTILINPPTLTFFSAYTAAVKVNNLDPIVGKNHACDMLSCIRKYINSYHQNLSQYIRYEIDHSNTYKEELVERIKQRIISDADLKQTKESLTNHAENHGSDQDGAIHYASMHLIIFKDIMEKNSSHLLFHSLDENINNIQIDQSTCLYDCIITIGGSVEQKFNKIRYLVRQAFIQQQSQQTNEKKNHFPLSIRMLSKAGQIPVYYHNKSAEITVHHILENDIKYLNLNEKRYADIKEDISILRKDIGLCILKSIYNDKLNLESSQLSSWENIISSLIDLSLDVWRTHAKNDNQSCSCLVENQQAIDQFCKHYELSNHLNHHQRLIISCILNLLETKIGFLFGQINAKRRFHLICTTKDTTKAIFNELDRHLDQILIGFIRENFS